MEGDALTAIAAIVSDLGIVGFALWRMAVMDNRSKETNERLEKLTDKVTDAALDIVKRVPVKNTDDKSIE